MHSIPPPTPESLPHTRPALRPVNQASPVGGELLLDAETRGVDVAPHQDLGELAVPGFDRIQDLVMFLERALGATALRLFHAQDASVMVLVWQFGSVALLTGLGALTGRQLLRWPAPGLASS